MKRLFLLPIIITATIGLAFSQANNQPSEEDLSKLDFWVGEWDLTWEGGKGKNVIEKTLKGRVIQENFKATEGNFNGYLGMSISTFDPRDGKWHQAWADSQGGFINLIGIMDGDQRIFQLAEPGTMPDGTQFINRMRFYDIQEDSFTWDWERSTDDGKNWQLNWRIQYNRSK
ncbi:DUF1579 domain-containing protein [Portibacter marinus]|uniref:DUF1579 domain-containing protein n=1 Tax=Portibacter marinus TaxID=2898660 RepID=UPI001F219765|nr:DUF1579 domain-containing protein [Portibacter marinus]